MHKLRIMHFPKYKYYIQSINHSFKSCLTENVPYLSILERKNHLLKIWFYPKLKGHDVIARYETANQSSVASEAKLCCKRIEANQRDRFIITFLAITLWEIAALLSIARIDKMELFSYIASNSSHFGTTSKIYKCPHQNKSVISSKHIYLC